MQITDLVYIDSTGYHFADYPTFLQWIQDQYKFIYGADVYLGSDSQDGQFLAILALAFYQLAALGASIYNSFSPTTAQGTGLARNVKINGIKKQNATYSFVTLTIVGTAGTIITNGIAQDILDQKWILPVNVTIPLSGTIDVIATAENAGTINAVANTITKIFTPTLGWQTVNNAAGATAGLPIETDAQLRDRQSKSTANPSLTVIEGTYGAIANITGVTKVQPYENATDAPDSNGIPAHCISMSVLGGDAYAILGAIFLHKTPGCNTFGNTTGIIYDSKGLPNTINFNRPTLATISVRITITTFSGWTVDYEALIQQAISDYINSLDIGGRIVLNKLYKFIYLASIPASTFTVTLLEIKKDAGAFGTTDIALTYNEYANTALTDVTFL